MKFSKPFVVLGSDGWIGSSLLRYLLDMQQPVVGVTRSDLPAWLSETDDVGPVIYTIGLTSDFRSRPFATCDAHVCVLCDVLKRKGIVDLIYLSSTRVYSRSESSRECDPVMTLSSDPSDLYNLSKLFGESLVLQTNRHGFKVVRLSNVIGPSQPVTTFLGSLLRDAKSSKNVVIYQHPNTSKDYISLTDVQRLIYEIAVSGNNRIYNLGSGYNIKHSEIACWLRSQGVAVSFSSSPVPPFSFPPLSIERLCAEFLPPGHPFSQNLL